MTAKQLRAKQRTQRRAELQRRAIGRLAYEKKRPPDPHGFQCLFCPSWQPSGYSASQFFHRCCSDCFNWDDLVPVRGLKATTIVDVARLLMAGYRMVEVALAFGVNESTVRRWLTYKSNRAALQPLLAELGDRDQLPGWACQVAANPVLYTQDAGTPVRTVQSPSKLPQDRGRRQVSGYRALPFANGDDAVVNLTTNRAIHAQKGEPDAEAQTETSQAPQAQAGQAPQDDRRQVVDVPLSSGPASALAAADPAGPPQPSTHESD